ncbi:MAG: MFS transporter [Acetobacteraceae bacterium]|nr:MFS transporter [Acetobacteraceae bacterium]
MATIAIDALGFGIVVPVVPQLVMQLGRLSEADAAVWLAMLLAAFSLMQFLCAPLLGALSDRFGRRLVLLASLSGMCLNYLMLAWAPGLPWLFVGRVVAGATAANYSAATAYIADVTPAPKRAQRFGLVGAMFGLGFVAGPALGGALGGYWLRLPFLVAAALAGGNMLYAAIFLPESLPVRRRRRVRWAQANPVGSIHVLANDRDYRRLAVAWCCTWFALGALQSAFVLANSLRLGWGARENGIALAVVGIASALVQGLLVRRIVPALGERRAALLGYGVSFLAYLAFAFAAKPWILFLGTGLQACGAISGPAVQSLFSSRAGPDQQGRIQGALASVQGLTAIVAPLAAGSAFSTFAAANAKISLVGAPFLMAAAAYVLAFASVWKVRARERTPSVSEALTLSPTK